MPRYTGPAYLAITTKYTASVITASCERGKTRIPYDHALNAMDNHYTAAMTLIDKLEWRHKPDNPLVGGSTKDGYVWVFA